MDRNTRSHRALPTLMTVALRKESVDRNVIDECRRQVCIESLSARRAWIEMRKSRRSQSMCITSLSARRAWIEIFYHRIRLLSIESLSARRAWIEMQKSSTDTISPTSLSARRAWIEIPSWQQPRRTFHRRSPQGERG